MSEQNKHWVIKCNQAKRSLANDSQNPRLCSKRISDQDFEDIHFEDENVTLEMTLTPFDSDYASNAETQHNSRLDSVSEGFEEVYIEQNGKISISEIQQLEEIDVQNDSTKSEEIITLYLGDFNPSDLESQTQYNELPILSSDGIETKGFEEENIEQNSTPISFQDSEICSSQDNSETYIGQIALSSQTDCNELPSSCANEIRGILEGLEEAMNEQNKPPLSSQESQISPNATFQSEEIPKKRENPMAVQSNLESQINHPSSCSEDIGENIEGYVGVGIEENITLVSFQKESELLPEQLYLDVDSPLPLANKRRSVPVYVGDFVESDLECPLKRHRYWEISQATIKKLRHIGRYHTNKISRLRKLVEKLEMKHKRTEKSTQVTEKQLNSIGSKQVAIQK